MGWAYTPPHYLEREDLLEIVNKFDYSKVKVAIALPHTDSSTMSPFMDSFFVMDRPFPHTYLRPIGGGTIDLVRNQLVKKAEVAGCTHIFMADTDQIYPQDTLMKLLAHDLPIVGGKVHSRWEPYSPILLRGECPSYFPIPEEEWKSGGLVEVDATGTGCLLIRLDVFKKIEYPWFKCRFFENPPVGEDIDFMSKCKEAGIKIYVDCDIKVGHMIISLVTESNYWAYKSVEENPQTLITNMKKVV